MTWGEYFCILDWHWLISAEFCGQSSPTKIKICEILSKFVQSSRDIRQATKDNIFSSYFP